MFFLGQSYMALSMSESPEAWKQKVDLFQQQKYMYNEQQKFERQSYGFIRDFFWFCLFNKQIPYPCVVYCINFYTTQKVDWANEDPKEIERLMTIMKKQSYFPIGVAEGPAPTFAAWLTMLLPGIDPEVLLKVVDTTSEMMQWDAQDPS